MLAWEQPEQRQTINGTQRHTIVLKKETSPTKDEVQAAADAKGESLNAYIVEAIRQRLESDMPTEDTAGKETA